MIFLESYEKLERKEFCDCSPDSRDGPAGVSELPKRTTKHGNRQFQGGHEKKIGSGVGGLGVVGQDQSGHLKGRYFFLGLTD